MKRKFIEAQTHVRIFKEDKLALDRYMRRKNIRSQAQALRRLLRKK